MEFICQKLNPSTQFRLVQFYCITHRMDHNPSNAISIMYIQYETDRITIIKRSSGTSFVKNCAPIFKFKEKSLKTRKNNSQLQAWLIRIFTLRLYFRERFGVCLELFLLTVNYPVRSNGQRTKKNQPNMTHQTPI